MTPISIFVADDHPVVSKGIKAVFADLPGYEVVGEAGDGLEALQRISSLKPDIVIMDITMPELDGILVTERLTKELPGTKVIIFSMHQDHHFARDAFRAGAMAYVLKGGDPDEILSAIKKVRVGMRYASPSIAEEILSDFVDIVKGDKVLGSFDALSLREKEIVKLVAGGSTSKEIAGKLFLSPATIKNYRVHIMRKLKVKDTAGLVREAIRNKLIRLE